MSSRDSLRERILESEICEELIHLKVLLVLKNEVKAGGLIHGQMCEKIRGPYTTQNTYYKSCLDAFQTGKVPVNMELISLKAFAESEKYCPDCNFLGNFYKLGRPVSAWDVVHIYSSISKALVGKPKKNFDALDALNFLPDTESFKEVKKSLFTRVVKNLFVFSKETETCNEDAFKEFLSVKVFEKLNITVKENSFDPLVKILEGTVKKLKEVNGYVIFDSSEFLIYYTFTKLEKENVSVLKRILLNPMFTLDDKFCVLPYHEFKFMQEYYHVRDIFVTNSVFVETLPDESVMETFKTLVSQNTFSSYAEAFEVAVNV